MAARSLPIARAEVRTAALAAELLQLGVSGGLCLGLHRCGTNQDRIEGPKLTKVISLIILRRFDHLLCLEQEIMFIDCKYLTLLTTFCWNTIRLKYV